MLPTSELRLELPDLAGLLLQLRVGGPFPHPGQGPADGLRAVARDARRDQRVHGLQVRRAEPGHDGDQALTVALERAPRPSQPEPGSAALALLGSLVAQDE